jgi:hypothetical protein
MSCCRGSSLRLLWFNTLMLPKSRRSAWILAAASAASVFIPLFILQSPDLSDPTRTNLIGGLGLALFLVTAWTFYTVIVRSDARYFGVIGLVGWIAVGLLLSLSLWWVQRIYPSTLGLFGVLVFGFILLRWLVFLVVWKLAVLLKV